MEPNWREIDRSKWWLQSVLTGTERIIVGVRTREGVVVDVKETNINEVE